MIGMTEGFWPTGGDGEKNGAAEKRVSSAPDSRTGGSDEDNTLLAFKDEDEDEDENISKKRYNNDSDNSDDVLS